MSPPVQYHAFLFKSPNLSFAVLLPWPSYSDLNSCLHFQSQFLPSSQNRSCLVAFTHSPWLQLLLTFSVSIPSRNASFILWPSPSFRFPLAQRHSSLISAIGFRPCPLLYLLSPGLHLSIDFPPNPRNNNIISHSTPTWLSLVFASLTFYPPISLDWYAWFFFTPLRNCGRLIFCFFLLSSLFWPRL